MSKDTGQNTGHKHDNVDMRIAPAISPQPKTNIVITSNTHKESDTATSQSPQDRKAYHAQYYADNKEEIAARRKAARLARHEEITAAERERYATDPIARERRLKINAKGKQTYRERIATDPAAKQRHEEQLAKRRQRHKERMATDPIYRKQREEFAAALREKRRNQRKNEPSQNSE